MAKEPPGQGAETRAQVGRAAPARPEIRGVPRVYLRQLVERGELLKTGRGLYVQADAPLTENHSLAEAAKLSPKGVDLSAVRAAFSWSDHGKPSRGLDCRFRAELVRQSPALRHCAWCRFSGKMMTEGIERHVIQGVTVEVYSVAKTVADCFRFRNRIGVNIAVEALRDAWRNKKATSEELWHYAKVCRVLNVMRPYFDSLA